MHSAFSLDLNRCISGERDISLFKTQIVVQCRHDYFIDVGNSHSDQRLLSI